MRLGRVCGTVVSTVKAAGLARYKLLLVEDVDAQDPAGSQGAAGGAFVAIDLVGVGVGEIVLVTHGSGARIDDGTGAVPTDAAIVAIVDSTQLAARTTFVKH